MKKVLIGVDEELWGRMKARAASRGELIGEVVGRAFRQHLAWREDGSSESSAETALRPQSEPSSPELESTLTPVERLRALVNTVRPGSVLTAREVARAREARRGDEGGSQVPEDEDFRF